MTPHQCVLLLNTKPSARDDLISLFNNRARKKRPQVVAALGPRKRKRDNPGLPLESATRVYPRKLTPYIPPIKIELAYLLML